MSIPQKILLWPPKVPLLKYLVELFTLSSWPLSSCVGICLYTYLMSVSSMRVGASSVSFFTELPSFLIEHDKAEAQKIFVYWIIERGSRLGLALRQRYLVTWSVIYQLARFILTVLYYDLVTEPADFIVMGPFKLSACVYFCLHC